MTPSSKWFPLSLQERAAWYTNFNTQIAGLGASLGITPAEITSINNDSEVLTFLSDAAVSLDAYMAAARAYRKTITEGQIGDPTPTFPSDTTTDLPVIIATGMFERLDGYVKRIRVAPAFTEEIGESLGILPSSTPIEPIGSSAPKFDCFPQPGGEIDIKFVKGSSAGIFVQTNTDGGGWIDQGRFIRSPASVLIPANEGHTPSNVMIRARFLDGNEPVGAWSAIQTVQTIP